MILYQYLGDYEDVDKSLHQEHADTVVKRYGPTG